VRDVSTTDDRAILQGVISLAAASSVKLLPRRQTVAHGVMLLRLGCELAQVYVAGPCSPTDARLGHAQQPIPRGRAAPHAGSAAAGGR
jgi:hypothetical protein